MASAEKIVPISDAAAQPGPPVKVADLEGGAAYLRKRGVAHATTNMMRSLIRQKKLHPIPLGKKFYVSLAELDGLIEPGKKK